MTKKEANQISIWLSTNAKGILDEERTKLGLSRAAYLEKLIEGSLPNRLEEKIEELRLEIESLREQLNKPKGKQ